MAKQTAFRAFADKKFSLGQASESFRLRCQAQNLSPNTIAWYMEIFKHWRRFLESRGVEKVEKVTPALKTI